MATVQNNAPDILDDANDQSVVFQVMNDDDDDISSAGLMSTTMHSAQSVPPKIISTKDKTKHASSQSGTYQLKLSAPRKRLGAHMKQVSVSNLIPSRYLNQASSLIALLDQSRAQSASPQRPISKKNIQFKTKMKAAKSTPTSTNDNYKENTPSLNSDDDYDGNAALDEKDENEPNKSTTNTNITKDDNISAYNSKRQSMESLVIHDLAIDDDNPIVLDVNGAGSGGKSVVDELINMNQDKHNEYMSFVSDDNDNKIDMHTLAVNAAQEFTELANANEKLVKEHEKLKEQYSDLLDWRSKIEKEMENLKNDNNDASYINDELEILKSKISQWEIEKKFMVDQINEYERIISNNNHDAINNYDDNTHKKNTGSITKLKLTRDTSDNGNTLMMETLAKVTKENLELQQVMAQEQHMKREFEKENKNLRKQLKKSEQERKLLYDNLDKQQKNYIKLQQQQNTKIQQLQEKTIDLTRKATQEFNTELDQIEKNDLLAAVDDQKAYIEQLEKENQLLQINKIKDDDDMFNQLQALRTHNFARSMVFGSDASSNLDGIGQGNHSRAGSESISTFALGLGSGIDLYNTGQLKSVRTQINLLNHPNFDDDYIDENDENELDDTMVEHADHDVTNMKPDPIDLSPPPGDNNSPITPVPDDDKKPKKKVSFLAKNSKKLLDDPKKKEEKKRKKLEEISKINAEIEFFLLTCIAVKSNLVEEYPDKPEVITEDAMKLFNEAQKEHVGMAKFSLWIELKLRVKYNLPKLRGFKKFINNTQEKMDKTKQKSKKAVKRAGTLIKGAGKGVASRVRAGTFTDAVRGTDKTTKKTNGTIVEEQQTLKKTQSTDDIINAQQAKIQELEKELQDKSDITDKKQCCIIM